jgi:LysM repeat protein
MQQIERYGVIALVFLLVTIVAVSFWGDSKSPGFWSRLTGKAKKDEVAKVEAPLAGPTAEQALATNAPLNNVPAPTLDATQAAPLADPAAGAVPPPAPVDGALALGAQPAAPVGLAPVTQQPGMVQPPVAEVLPLAQPASSGGAREYTVQKGDSLALIARRTLGSEQRWTEIQALNNGLQPKSLKVGMKLKLPADSTVAQNAPSTKKAAPANTKLAQAKPADVSAKPASAAKSSPKASSSTHYTIRKGDTLYSIAEQKLGGKSHVKELLAANPGLDARKLVVGRTITLPGRGKSNDSAPVVASASKSSKTPASNGARVR